MMRSPSLRSMSDEMYRLIGSTADTADPKVVRARRAAESSLESLRQILRSTAARRPRFPAERGRWVAVGAVTVLCGITLGVLAARRARARARSELTRGDWQKNAGAWKQIRGKLKERWGELTDDDIERLSGQGEQLAGKLQQRYGMAREEAERQVREFRSRHRWD
jgi:uncharacterized protein YjbJ (UPF0337 family)